MHLAIEEELSMLKERFPGKSEMTLDEYAVYFCITRHYASQHFSNINMGTIKINHKRIGKKIIIPFVDFAYWLAQKKIVDGKPFRLEGDIEAEMKRRRGFSAAPKHNYRQLG